MKRKYLRRFFVDYDSIAEDGLKGWTRLGKSDHVTVYYRNKDGSIPIYAFDSQVGFDTVVEDLPLKNAVRYRILFDIRDSRALYGESEFYIVSGDDWYDKAIKKMDGGRLFRIGRIKDHRGYTDLPESLPGTEAVKAVSPESAPGIGENDDIGKDREREVREYIESNLSEDYTPDEIGKIIASILGGRTKVEVNNLLVKAFLKTGGTNKVGEIYKLIKPLISDMPGT